MNKVRIFFYSGHGEVVGGDARYVFDLINNLNSDKYETQLFTDKNYLFKKRAQQWLKKDIPIHYLDTRPILFKKNLIQKLSNTIETYRGKNKLIGLARTILNTDFLLEHTIYQWLNYIYYRIVEIITLAKLRYTIHNALLFYGLLKNKKQEIDIFHFNNGGYPAKEAVLIAIMVAYFVGIRNIVMTTHSVAQPKKWYNLLDYIFDCFIPKFCKTVIMPSQNLRIEFNKRRKFSLDIITAIPLGLNDIKELLSANAILKKKKELGLDPDQPILMIVGALYGTSKGHYVLLEAFAKVKKQFPQAVLLVVGDGKGRLDLERRANKLKIGSCIKFLGYRQDINELNSIIDIAVVPSIGYEAIPYAIREALRDGKAVITTDAGGCAEAVKHGVNGLVVRQNDSDDLAQAIIKLLENKETIKKMGEQGRKIFEKKFLLSAEINKHEHIYSNMLDAS